MLSFLLGPCQFAGPGQLRGTDLSVGGLTGGAQGGQSTTSSYLHYWSWIMEWGCAFMALIKMYFCSLFL